MTTVIIPQRNLKKLCLLPSVKSSDYNEEWREICMEQIVSVQNVKDEDANEEVAWWMALFHSIWTDSVETLPRIVTWPGGSSRIPSEWMLMYKVSGIYVGKEV